MKKYLLLLLLLCGLAGCTAAPDHSAAPETEGVVIALLDTGVSTTAIQSEKLLPGWNYVTGSADTEDRINHGTAVASVILGCNGAGVTGLAPAAYVVPLVVTDKTGEGTESVSPQTLAQAVRDSVDKYGADIINVSLGIKKDVPELEAAVEYAAEQGALVVSAVGNGGDSAELYYPAAYEGVLATGSHDEDGLVSDFTQLNGTADILAPGEDIWLASKNGKTYGARGTSYATGYVTAAAAELWLRFPELEANDVRGLLISSAGTADGWRILDAQAALDLAAG